MAKRILVTEDNEDNRPDHPGLVDEQRLRADRGCDGGGGVELAQSHHPDLILMDVQLPGHRRLRGDATRSRSTRACRVPVITVTSTRYAATKQKPARPAAMVTSRSLSARAQLLVKIREFWPRAARGGRSVRDTASDSHADVSPT